MGLLDVVYAKVSGAYQGLLVLAKGYVFVFFV